MTFRTFARSGLSTLAAFMTITSSASAQPALGVHQRQPLDAPVEQDALGLLGRTPWGLPPDGALHAPAPAGVAGPAG
jgi:hypothetical protein